MSMAKAPRRRRAVALAGRAPGLGLVSGSVQGNPFEVKVNKQKFHILGRKTRHDVGHPGAMRSRAHKKRTQTLLKEYKEKEKSNVFKDKRFGEYDNKISPEDKMMKRFALEQQKNYEKKHIYNLNEEEDLTHYGHSLANIEKLDDIIDSDSDTEERGILSAELTAAHFGGGGLLRKKTLSGQQDEENRQAKSRKELIEELIAKSKQEKRERQTQRENTQELTEKLNSDWKEIQGLLFHRTSKSEMENHVVEKLKPDEYDMMVRELGFEMKVQPSSRMKTEEELAKEEKERLLKLEADRLRRMRGEDEQEMKKNSKHISADDLADGFLLDKDDRHFLSYKDGKLNIEGDKDEEGNVERKEDDTEKEDSEEESDTESEQEDSKEESDAEAEAVDSHSDWEADVEETSKNEGQKRQMKCNKNKLQTKKQNSVKEAAKLELPYLFDAPESFEQLKALLSEKPIEEQLLVIERIQKSNHPSLAVGNKAKLEKLFEFLLEYVGELACKEPPELKTIDNLVQPLHNLCQMFPKAASNHVKFVLQDAIHDLEKIQEDKGHAAFPGLNVLMYLKIIAVLFPTSDFWHPVVTPSLVYMSLLLTKCPVTTLQDVVKGLFVCCLFLEYVSLSQRFVPEVINFLSGILHMAALNRKVQGYTLIYPFGSLKKQLDLLVVSEKADTETWQKQSLPLHMITRLKEKGRMEVNHLRLSCLGLCLDLIKKCAALYGPLPSFREIVQPIEILLSTHIPVKQYPKPLQELCDDVLKQLKVKGQYCPLVCEKKKPVPLKLFTPKLVKVLEFGRKQESNRREQERRRLIHKHKRELKGAVREIRKDNQFLARMQLAEVMERDSERKRKVKQLFSSLAQQEGDWKAMKKKKF